MAVGQKRCSKVRNCESVTLLLDTLLVERWKEVVVVMAISRNDLYEILCMSSSVSFDMKIQKSKSVSNRKSMTVTWLDFWKQHFKHLESVKYIKSRK